MKGLTRLKRYYRRLNDYLDPKAVILMYHRVAELTDYAYPIVVTPDNFRQQMAYLRKAFQPIGLNELADGMSRGSIPRRSVVITFDDGYADNYLSALPILEEFQIPATIFVSSGYIDGCREYWWDDLERIFLSSDRVPERLEISIRGKEYSWNLNSMEQRRSVRKEIHLLIKPLDPQDREQLLEILTQWASLERQGRAKHRAMTRDELRQLSNSPLIQIGGHTVNHPQLAVLPVELQYWEIMRGRQELEMIIGRTIKTFSYPFGESEDLSSDTVEAVKAAGFQVACSTFPDRVTRNIDIYKLPRYWVGDWTAENFQIQIADFFRR